MSDAPLTESDTPLTDEAAPDFLQTRATAVSLEIITDSHRITGELRSTGGPRRLVDILNSVDTGVVVVQHGCIESPSGEAHEPRPFTIMQLDRDAILLAIPKGPTPPSDPFEIVKKVAVPCTILLPGLDITGNIYFAPVADPTTVPIIPSHHFAAITDATAVSVFGRAQSWREPVILVNMARALAYAPR